jgi:hypothetical protein
MDIEVDISSFTERCFAFAFAHSVLLSTKEKIAFRFSHPISLSACLFSAL